MLRDWKGYRGRALEPLVRDALERLLVDELFGAELCGARHVGACWTRTHETEVDLVGGDAPDPTAIGFVGSVKWHENERVSPREAAALAQHRAQVPGAAAAKLLVVSRSGAEPAVDVDATLGPEQLLGAWG